MNRVILTAVLGSSMALGAAAFAQDTSGNMSNHPTRKELMQQCMDQQKAQNPSAAEKDMKKTCHDQVKMEIAQRSQQSPSRPAQSNDSPPTSPDVPPVNPAPPSPQPR